ncbi:unnamed protein product [Closterium sp. NIES-54]
MVGAVVDTGVVDTLEARQENARRRHEANEYGDLPWAVVEAGIRAVWATEHPPWPVSPRLVNTKGGVNAGGGHVSSSAGGTSRQRGVIFADEVGGVQARGMWSSATAGSSQGNLGGRRSGLSPMSAIHVTAGGIAPSYGYFKFTPKILVTPLLVGQPDILAWKEAIEPQLEMAGLIGFARGTVATPEDPDLRAEFRAVQLLTFTVISRCCSPGLQIALKSCRVHLDTGHRAWHFIESTYQVTDDLFIGQLEGQLTHLRMGDQETATDYCNRAQRILATIRIAGVQYSMASYVTHVMQGLPSNYNLLKKRSMAPSTWATLNEDTLTSHILKSAKDSGRGGGSRRRECWLCGDPDRSDSDDDNAKGGCRRSGSRCPRRGGNKPRKEKQSTKSTSAMDADSSADGKGQNDEESCSLVGVMELTVLLASEASEDFQAMAAAVQANPEVVLLDSGGSHHLVGTKAAFANLGPSGNFKHVRGFNGALQDVHGRGTVALQGEARRQVLVPDVLYVPGVQANLLSAGQLKENGVKLQEDGDRMLLVTAAGDILGWASYTGRVLCTDLRPGSVKLTMPTMEVVALRRLSRGVPGEAVHRLREREGDRPQPDLPLHPVAERHGGARDEDSGGVGTNDAAAHRRAAPLVAPRSTQAVWVRNCLEPSTLQPGTTPYRLLTGKKPDLSMARVWGCMAHFLVPKQQCGGKLKPKARWGLHLGVSAESKGWELLVIADNWVVTKSDVVFYKNMSLEVWKSEHGLASGRMPTTQPKDTSTATLPLLAEVGEPAAKDIEDVSSPFPSPAPPVLSLVANLRRLTPASASGDEGSSGASPKAPTKSIAGGRCDVQQVDMRVMSTLAREEETEELQPTMVESEKGAAARQHPTREQAMAKPTTEQSAIRQSAGELTSGEHWAGTPTVVQQDADGSDDVVEVQGGPRRTGRLRRPPDFFVRAAFTTMYNVDSNYLMYDDGEDDDELPELDPDMHADPEYHWDISTMTVEALASWKGMVVKAAMEEEIRSLVSMGTWELVERLPGVNIMKNRWVLTSNFHIDDTVERKKARLVVKGFTQVYGADYDETYAPVSSYVTLRIFLSIVAVLDLSLMQLDMKNSFLQSKLDRVLYMHRPDYFNDGTGRVCKLLKSLYGLKQSPLLWYRALDGVLLGAGWKKSQVDTALYFKVGDDKAAFKLGETSPVQKYLGLEILRDWSARKLWLHQQGYADKLRRLFLDEEQTGRTPKMPVSVDAYAELTFDDEDSQERKEEEYRQKVGSLQFAATTTRPDIALACSKMGSSLTVRSDQHWRKVDRCLAYLANTRDTTLEFGGGAESLKLVGYVDADDVGNKQNRTSTGGYMFVYGGAAVFWSSQRIKCATLSSTESEYVAATEAGKKGRRLCFLLAEFRQLDVVTPTVLRMDNKSAIMNAEGMGLTSNLKHMERRQAWLQHMVKHRKFSLHYIPTAEQPADFLTKVLHYPAFNRCPVTIGQVRLADVGDGGNDVQQ